MADTMDGTEDQPGAEHDQTQIQEHQRRKQGHHFLDAVIARGRDQRELGLRRARPRILDLPVSLLHRKPVMMHD